MEQEGIDTQKSRSVAGEDGPLVGMQEEASRPSTSRPRWSPQEPTVLTLQDLLDLPKQVLPEETYRHLRNAGREAALAVYSLWRNIERSRKGGTGRTRTRIDVE